MPVLEDGLPEYGTKPQFLKAVFAKGHGTSIKDCDEFLLEQEIIFPFDIFKACCNALSERYKPFYGVLGER